MFFFISFVFKYFSHWSRRKDGYVWETGGKFQVSRVFPLQEEIKFFFTVNDSKDAPENAWRRKATLLSLKGSETYGLVRDLSTPNRSIDQTFSEIVEVLKNHFQPKPSEDIQWYKFYTRVSKTDELVANFVVDLKRLSEDCIFEATLETMIRGRVVFGINEESIQRRLLFERDLTFKRTFEIVHCMEGTRWYVTELSYKSQSEGVNIRVVHRQANEKWSGELVTYRNR